MAKFVKVSYRHKSNVPAVIKAMRRASTKSINEQLQEAVFIAKQRVPYLTGRLLRSIRILRYSTEKGSRTFGRMGSLQPYANKINLQQRENLGRGYMDVARASLTGLKSTLSKEWAKAVAHKRLNRRRD